MAMIVANNLVAQATLGELNKNNSQVGNKSYTVYKHASVIKEVTADPVSAVVGNDVVVSVSEKFTVPLVIFIKFCVTVSVKLYVPV